MAIHSLNFIDQGIGKTCGTEAIGRDSVRPDLLGMEVVLASDLGLGERFWARTNKIEAEGRSEFQLSVYSNMALMKWLEKPMNLIGM